jgi:hypothetical protein
MVESTLTRDEAVLIPSQHVEPALRPQRDERMADEARDPKIADKRWTRDKQKDAISASTPGSEYWLP